MQLIRRIRHLLYDEGFTISGARNRLGGGGIIQSDAQAAVRLSATELQSIRSGLLSVKAALDKALAS